MRVTPAIVLAVLLLSPRSSLAQMPEPRAVPPRAFVDLNLLGTISSASGSRTFTGRFVTFGEAGSSNAIYPKPGRALQAPSIDVAAGYMTTKAFGLAINFSRMVFDDAVRLASSVPHPQVLNSAGVGEGVTDEELSRNETMLSLNAVVVPLKTERSEARIIGGLSYFWLDAEMVSDVTYSQTATPQANEVSVTGFTVERGKGQKLGLNIGGDYTHFFTRRVGVKAGLRFSHAIVPILREPLSRRGQEMKVGGLTFFLGARFRFGN